MPKLRLFFFTLLLASCSKTQTAQDPCTQFNGTQNSAPYHVFIGKALDAKEKKAISAAIDQTFAEIDSLFNPLNPQSEIAKINAAPADKLLPLSSSMQELFAFCEKWVGLSGGRFNPTGIGSSDWSGIAVKNGILKKDHSQTAFCFDGIFRGIWIDCLVGRLQKLGYADVFVEWGGEMKASGRHPVVGSWPVQINPQLRTQGKPLSPIRLSNQAIASRGESPEKKPIETISPSVAFATVIAPSCALAEALASCAMRFPTRKEAEKWAQEVVDLYPEVSFWILSYGKE